MMVSVIVPVYNTAVYLEKCVNSLLSQTYKDYEIILVNDGSTDNSLAVCDRLKQLDNRISVYSKENGGLSSSRNLGIKKAKGDYVVFLDSDDWFEPDMLEHMTAPLNDQEYDVIIQGFFVDFEGENNTFCECFDHNLGFVGNIAEAVIVAEEKSLFNSCCNKLYRKSLLSENNLLFSLNKEPAEDLLFNCECFKYVKSVFCLDYMGYHYIKRNVKTLTAKYYPDYECKILEFYEARKSLYVSINLESQIADKWLKNSLSSYTLTAISNLYRHEAKLSFKERTEKIAFLFDDNRVRDSVLNSEFVNLYIRLIRLGIRVNRTWLSNLLFSTLFKMRYSLEPIYLKLRKKILYSRGD